MPSLICSYCSSPADDDMVATHCPDCGGKIIDSSVKYARELAVEDEIDQLWNAYYAVKRGDAEIAARTPEPGFLMRRQAGG